MLKTQACVLRAYINRKTLVTLYNFFKLIHRKITMSRSNDEQSSEPRLPPFDPSQPSIPISYPIKTLGELASRSYFDSFHYPFNRSSVPLRWNMDLPDRPRILVCHDMKGGYIDDKWVQGCQNEAAYAIWHWYLMDVFVYFAHSLVNLPPPCWTNAAHKHGVKVLGTFITEWDEGTAICKALLATRESAQMYAERLAELADALGFDGWLINVENEIGEEQVPNLKEFVAHLTETMHFSVPGSLVIWYDSVTVDGKLKWQDQLNEKNKPFFDICDGIFMNYTWKENYPKLSADVAVDRKYDVYMGIDVFGRGSYGGGQWTTNVALDVLKKNNVSAAIFAPGWILETEQPPDFHSAQNRWWALIEKTWGIVQTYPKILPFYSDFDQGHGYHTAFNGCQLSDGPWYNLSRQSLQPVLELDEKHIRFSVDVKEASYNGGGNMAFRGSLEENDHFTARLFRAELHLEDSPIFITYSVKSENSFLLGLLLHFSSSSNERNSVLLASSATNQLSTGLSRSVVPFHVTSSQTASGWTVYEASVEMNRHTLTEICAVCYRQEESRRITPSVEPNKFFALLGHISIKYSQQSSGLFPPSSSWLIEAHHVELKPGDAGSRSLSGKLEWKLKEGHDCSFAKCNIFVEKLLEHASRKLLEVQEPEREFLGVAHVNAYYVSDLIVPSGIMRLRFIVQACADDGSCQKLDDSASFLLDLDQ